MKGEDNSFGLSVSVLTRGAGIYFQKNLKPFGLGPGQQAYLLALSPGEHIIQDELATRLKVDKANVTRAIKGLEQLGYIDRQIPPLDKRSKLISLSSEGLKVRVQLETLASDWVSSLKSVLTQEEWETTVRSLAKMAESIH